MLTEAINFIAGIAGIAAVAVIIYGGFLYFTSGPEEGQGKVVAGLTGLAIILLAYVLVQFVLSAFQGGI